MAKRIFVLAFLAAVSSMSGTAAQSPAAPGPLVEVYKDPNCGCCINWVKHLEANGFTTRVMDVANLAEVKTKNRVPAEARSCHTGIVDGYVLEGHVPAADVKRLLNDRPPVLGLAVPGMPIGSPGMEVPNVPAQPYNVVTFDRDGQVKVYASH
jgi:hypothetical protein